MKSEDIALVSSAIRYAMKLYTNILCCLLSMTDTRILDLLYDYLFSRISEYANILAESIEAKRFEDTQGKLIYRYALRLMLPFLLTYYLVYEPFVTYARYPDSKCGPQDIKDSTFIVRVSEQLFKAFKESFKCVEEFIDEKVVTKRCEDTLNAATKILSAIKETQ